jgi:hypothetical protein
MGRKEDWERSDPEEDFFFGQSVSLRLPVKMITKRLRLSRLIEFFHLLILVRILTTFWKQWLNIPAQVSKSIQHRS